MQTSKKLIVIVGPTASGKSDLAIRLARKYHGELISADSRQVYKGMDIGTGKVKRDGFTIYDSRFKKKNAYISQGVAHHLIDVASPKRQFTVTRYQKLARQAMKDIWRRGKLPIICGGTGHYVDALVYGQQFPKVKPDFTLRKKLGKRTVAELYAMLKKRDPRRAKTIDPRNPRRLIRSLEIVINTGKHVPPVSSHPGLDTGSMDSGFRRNDNVLWIGLSPPTQKLHQNIHKRLLARMKQGMIAEVKRLEKEGISSRRLEAFGLEYRHINRYLELSSRTRSGIHDHKNPDSHLRGNDKIKKEMLVQLERAIRRYAKRQMTWFRSNKKIHWVQSIKEAGKSLRKFLQS